MTAERAAAAVISAPYEARPGRQVLVIASLDDLRGPAAGKVTLPLWLWWSGPSRTFDLDRPPLRMWLYQIVLREASRPEDLTAHLDRDTLVSLWPSLRLPKGVRQAWEDHHPVLREASAAA